MNTSFLRTTFILTYLLLLSGSLQLSAQYSSIAQVDSAFIHKTYGAKADAIIKQALKDSSAHKRLQYICDTFGSRLSGSESLEKTIDWILNELKNDGFDNVHGENVNVPRWVRGKESCDLVEPRRTPLAMLGLGGSIATPPDGITAEVLVVHSFDELKKRASEARGKIVLYNVPFTSYRATVVYRADGASKAAEVGAVANLLRSVGPYSMRTPHTGGMRYADSITKIPSAAISSEDADMLDRMQQRGQKIVVKLAMEAKTMPDAVSRNVIAEIKGSEKPEEIVVLGGHIDSWDVGVGAMDDGGGCVATWRALKALKDAGFRPRRTVRLVMWTNEENGLRGGEGYAEQHGKEKHILALESDGGVFKPEGFGFEGTPEVFKAYKAVLTLLHPIAATKLSVGGGGADIGPLRKYSVPQMNISVEDAKYFWFHHTNADTPDKLNPLEINQCAAAMAVMVFVAADLP